MKRQVEFVNKVVKQGNSLCVRIPSTIKKELKLGEGKEIIVTIMPQECLYKYDDEMIQYLLNIAKKVKKLKRYNELKQRFFIILNFEFLKETTTKNQKEQKRKQIKFIKEKKERIWVKNY